MNKKIIMSLSVIAAVAAVVVGGTKAFFSDTETSTGNTFTAGAIDLKVDSQQHYNGNICVQNTEGPGYHWSGQAAYPVAGTSCDGTWTETDLGAQKFFNFTDVKPGDSGENTISLHVINNDAWACADVNITKNNDVSSTEPELDGTGDVLEDGANNFDGELAQNLYFTAWADDGDNVWEAGEPLLFTNQTGPASDVLGGKSYAIADATTGGVPMAGGVAKNIGLA
ncbi:MAG: TasA family protein, partial [Candidatus Moraniibacteriota bacterium]